MYTFAFVRVKNDIMIKSQGHDIHLFKKPKNEQNNQNDTFIYFWESIFF